MYKEKIIVPEGIRYISDWEKLEGGFSLTNFKSPSYIINKQITGCGFTENCLVNNLNIILCSPRKILLENKENQHCGEVFYYKNDSLESQFDKDISSDAKMRSTVEEIGQVVKKDKEEPVVSGGEDVLKLNMDVSDYFMKCLLSKKPCKILVTYDSFRHVKEALGDSISYFHIVVDEFQSIFTDSRFKSSTELEFLNHLRGLDKVCFVSATPMIDKYLEMLDEFKDIPYYELDWKSECPQRVIKPSIQVFPIKSITESVSKIITRYRLGDFEEYISTSANGIITRIPSTEAVFYVNSVTNICNIIKKNKLTQEECNILCARTSENVEKIRKAFGVTKKNFQGLGKIPKRGEPHKMFTLCTRTVYLGADFYSTCARSFVFSDANIECLAVDISLDLPQILGRQRLEENPWKNCAELYYKPLETDGISLTEEEFNSFVAEKVKVSNALLQTYKNEKDSFAKHALAIKYKQAISSDNYKTDYVAVNEHAGKDAVPVFNNLVMVSEMRAFEIQQVDYKDRFSVFNTVSSSNFELNTNAINAAITEFNNEKSFINKMRYLCSLPTEIVFSLTGFIPADYLNYYRVLGPDRIYALGTQKSKIDKEYKLLISSKAEQSQLASDIINEFQIGKKYPKSEIKNIILEVYKRYNIKKSVTATDIENYFETRPTKITVINDGIHKRVAGFEILSIKNRPLK